MPEVGGALVALSPWVDYDNYNAMTGKPATRAETKALMQEAYTAIKGNGKSLEIVFVSSDHDEAKFASYYKEMPWLALPFAERVAATSPS